MKRTIAGLVLALTAMGLPAVAEAKIKIKKVYFNPPGSDTGSATSLKAEYVLIKNTGGKAKKLAGWRIFDKGKDHTYRFPEGFKLGGGKVVRLRTGSGDDTRSDLYWDLANYVWNNDGDKVTLKKGKTRIDTCAYPSTAASPYVC